MKKLKKIPKLFRKKYSPKKFRKKILKRIHIPKDREMVETLFLPDEKGNLQIREEIPEDSRNKLEGLAKSIKKNKGMVSTWKAAILVVLLGAAVIFNLFYKDKAIKSLLEMSMEKVFKAESTIENPQLSLLKGIFSYDSLQIADSGNLSRNLIETGSAVFRLNIAELTRKRIHIEETSLRDFQWDTKREKSAGDTQEKQRSDTEGNDSEKQDLMETLALTPEEMDYQALLDSQKENLKSLNLINQGNKEVEEFQERWTQRFEDTKAEIQALREDVEILKSLDVQGVKSIEEGRDMLNQINSFYPTIEETTDSLKTMRQEFLDEKDHLTGLYGEIQSSIESDIDYLKNLLDFSGGDVKSLASGTAEKYIRKRWNDYYEKGMKALEIYERFQSTRTAGEEDTEKKAIRRNGRIIPFPSPDLPTILIKQISLSGGTDDSGILNSEILSLTDDPDKLDAPSTFSAGWNKENSSIQVKGVFDARTEAEEKFRMNIQSPGNRLALNDGVPAIQIDRVESVADITGVSYSIDSEGIMTELDIQLTSLEIEQTSSEGFLAEAVAEVMSGIQNVSLKAEILVSRKGIEKIKVKTDLDDILADSIGDYLKGLGDQADDMIREYLADYLRPYLEENELLNSTMDRLGVESLDQLSSMDAIEDLVDSRKKALTDKTDAIMAEAERLKAEAERRAREEAARIQAEADRLQAEAEAEAARQKAEAERKAQEEAEKAAEKLKIPGF